MNFNHTQPPWLIDYNEIDTIREGETVNGNPKRVAIAHVYENRVGKKESRANRQLICAAPEMIGALIIARDLIEETRPHSDALILIKEVIRKAVTIQSD